jgi:two-component system, chemotaxis family, sensor kinase CheA
VIYSLFDSLLEPVFVLNHEGHIIYSNETAATICGSTPRKLVRSKISLSQAIRFEETVDYLGSLATITTATPYKELKFSTDSYENGKAQITIQPYSPQPATNEYIVFFRDVTLEERLQKKYRAELEQKESYINELQSARNQLEIYNKDLESIVQKRTAEIQNLNVLMKALLDSLNQAFFVFDQNGVCAPLYSKACLDILELNPSGQKIWDVLKIAPAKVEGFKNWLFTVYSEMLPFEDLKPLGPDQIPHESKSVSLDYFPIRDQDGKIEKIVCVGSDVTDLVLAKAQAEQDREKVQSILKMIQNKKELRMFLLETKNQLVGMNQEFNELKNNPGHSRDSMLRILHTIKGGAATFSYNSLKETAHHLEEMMLSKDNLSPTSAKSLELKNKIETESASIFAFYKEVFGDLNPKDEDQILFNSSEIKALLALPKLSDVKNFIEEKVYFQPVKNLVSQFPIVIEKTAQLLEKSIHPLIVKNESTLVPNKMFDSFFNSFIHVLRNSVDHGVEKAKLRQNLGKDPYGTLSLEFSIVEQGGKFLQVKYRDDGQGINPSRIRAKLIKNRIPHSHLSDDQVIYFIFNPSFSTRDEVTETSGRGVGLDAVKYEVDQLGGSIKINTELGKYTEFVFLLPFQKQSKTQQAA